MLTTHAVGIDLGTTYSCIAHLNEHGEPITLSNPEGELSTPSVVLFDNDEAIVGTEALRNSILHPRQVVQNSKRFMGDPDQRWVINKKPYSPIDIATLILKKLIAAAQEQIGVIDHAVITVPAQFNDFQRHATIEAGHRAGLERVDIINEPVAAALCYVLGTEGLWFTELADEQKILVYDLGGGTFDLSLVRYRRNEVRVIAGSGDLHLGGIDWNNSLQNAIAGQFRKEFHEDPRNDPESLQFLALEVEQAKRSLSTRPRTALACQHAGHRRTYQVERTQFEKLTNQHVEHTAQITRRMLKDNKLGWAHIDVVLTTGGASRMPMVRERLKTLSGRTLNSSLSPELSIAHGATYYAGMLLTNSKFAKTILNEKAAHRLSQLRQRSVNARALGIFVRDVETNLRVPHYLISANTPLPTSSIQVFGTVVPGQRRVSLQIIESGASPSDEVSRLGSCVINDLPDNLPEGSEIAVTIRYDAEARVHVSARDVTSGREASTEILRHENVAPQLQSGSNGNADISSPDTDVAELPGESVPARLQSSPKRASSKQPAVRPAPKPQPVSSSPAAGDSIGGLNAAALPAASIADEELEAAERPIPLCEQCGEPIDHRGKCMACGTLASDRQHRPTTASGQKSGRKPAPKRKAGTTRRKEGSSGQRRRSKTARPSRQESHDVSVPLPPGDEDILELDDSALLNQSSATRPQSASAGGGRKKTTGTKSAPASRRKTKRKRTGDGEVRSGEDEFWEITD